MAEHADPLSEPDIDATNVLPAYEASLRWGATAAELEEELGWRDADLRQPGAVVSGASTCRHMELMASKPDYAGFVLAAVEGHTASSLGVVGLACRSCSTVAEALACPRRFQHLTNRTAEYAASIERERLTIVEVRHGEAGLGSRLLSDYTMLVAVQLLRILASAPPRVHGMVSRRSTMPAAERTAYADFLGAPVELGAERAHLELDTSLLEAPVATADDELAAYFQEVLHRAAGFEADEPVLIDEVRRAIREGLFRGTATASDVARALGLGQRTLQRRLGEHGCSFASLLDDTRRRLAESHLADPTLSLTEVAYLLGFGETASFYRAFRRWHPMTPLAYRRKHQRRG